MCIIIAAPEGKKISQETFELCADANPHGCGYSFINNSKIVIKKGLFTPQKLYSMYEKDYNDKRKFLIHFRYISIGTKSIVNCHPFNISNKYALTHNGTMHHVETHKKFSDSLMFSKLVEKLPNKWENNNSIMELLDEYVRSSKICILTNYNKFIFIGNEKSWVNDDGVMYSNCGYKKVDKTPVIYTPMRYAYNYDFYKYPQRKFSNKYKICGLEIIYESKHSKDTCFYCSTRTIPSIERVY